MSKKTIVLGVAGKDLTFEMNMSLYNEYINGLLPNNKVTPAHNLCVKAVTDECKNELTKLLKEPGAANQISQAILSDYAPNLEISVKKSTKSAQD